MTPITRNHSRAPQPFTVKVSFIMLLKHTKIRPQCQISTHLARKTAQSITLKITPYRPLSHAQLPRRPQIHLHHSRTPQPQTVEVALLERYFAPIPRFSIQHFTSNRHHPTPSITLNHTVCTSMAHNKNKVEPEQDREFEIWVGQRS